MNTYYCVYQQHGNWRRAALNESQYQRLTKDSSITSLSYFPTQILMEQGYAEVKGETFSSKRFLHG